METLLKWLNKPKADDKSLLARFFHADRALAAVASELDSFDGRAEPDRCSRLVSRLRQGQDKVLAITNLIIEELLGDERDQRAFRAKFPEEVLQENLAGQLWFGAECLAAGSSIMNREQESKDMRPLAEAVTRSLNNVRYLLRDQCLRNNVPNSERLNLDKNDAATEQLYESLKRFDRLFAEFEWRYVSAMVQVKSKEEYEMQELICVLCSETLQRALKLGLLEQDKVDAFDPALMFSIPRLAIVSGLVIYPQGPLNMDMPAEQLSEMFRPFRSILIKVREYLRNLNETELYYLERLLCTNEEIGLKDSLNPKDSSNATTVTDNNNTKSSKYVENSQSETVEKEQSESLKNTTTSKLPQKSSSSSCNKTFKTKPTKRADSPSPAPSTTSSSSDECSPFNTPVSSTPSSPRSTHSLVSTTSVGGDTNGTTSPDSWIEDEDEIRDINFLVKRDEDDHYADDDDSDMNDDGEMAENNDDKEDDDNHDNDDNLAEEDIDEDDENTSDIDSIDNVVEQIINFEMASADCAMGYLISNTTLGNLLQPQEVPLTDNFFVSDSDLPTNDDCNDNIDAELPSTSAKALTSTPTTTTATRNERQQQIEQENNDNNNSATTTSLSLQDESEEISISQQSSINNPSAATSSHTRRRRYNDQPQHHHHTHPQPQTTVCSKDSGKSSHRHHHRHGHHQHHHHHNHSHHTTTTATSTTTTGASTHSTTPNRTHHRHRLHHHHHHHRRPHRHGGGTKSSSTSSAAAAAAALQCDECVVNVTKEDSTIANSKAVSSIGLDIETPSSSSSILEDDNKTAARPAGRMKFKHTENLLHRLFVCIAGVADQLQTNFAFDLRQILRSVFLMNMSLAEEELDIPEKPKDNELFEFRASENDVIQESAGSSQSIYSAEEVNPEGDNQSNNSRSSSGSASSNSNCNEGNNRAYRHSTGTAETSAPTNTNETTIMTTIAMQRQQIERSRSLDNQDCPQAPTPGVATQIQPRQPQATQQRQSQHQHHHQIFRNRHNSTGSNSPSLSSSENSSPVCERTSTTNVSRRVSESNANNSETTQLNNTTQRSPVHLSPPAWIPDQKAPRCMSCNTPFTAFRRRHHCRNCGGVFCGVCSNTSAPLPKYGLTKAVRVCRACYVHELSTTNAASVVNNQQQRHHQHQHHHNHHPQLVSQTNVVTNTTNNEPRLRRPVTTTRAID